MVRDHFVSWTSLERAILRLILAIVGRQIMSQQSPTPSEDGYRPEVIVFPVKAKEAVGTGFHTKSPMAAALEPGSLEARRAGEMTAWGGAKRSPRYAKAGSALKARRNISAFTRSLAKELGPKGSERRWRRCSACIAGGTACEKAGCDEENAAEKQRDRNEPSGGLVHAFARSIENMAGFASLFGPVLRRQGLKNSRPHF